MNNVVILMSCLLDMVSSIQGKVVVKLICERMGKEKYKFLLKIGLFMEMGSWQISSNISQKKFIIINDQKYYQENISHSIFCIL